MEQEDETPTNTNKFLGIGTIAADPMRKREQFAVSLRKDKKKSILAQKRVKLISTTQSVSEYMGYWNGEWENFYFYVNEIFPDYDFKSGKVWPTTEVVNEILLVMQSSIQE